MKKKHIIFFTTLFSLIIFAQKPYRGAEYTVDTLPKIKLEILIEDDKLKIVTETITSSAGTGKIGDGKIFITSIDDVIRIRTGETGGDAI